MILDMVQSMPCWDTSNTSKRRDGPQVTFAYGMGPLAWSIIAFRNSLVFHSLDKNTSLFLHWFPAVVAWTQRWHYDPVTEDVIRGDAELKRDWNHASLTQLVFFPMVPYLAWAVAYYAKVPIPPPPSPSRHRTCWYIRTHITSSYSMGDMQK